MIEIFFKYSKIFFWIYNFQEFFFVEILLGLSFIWLNSKISKEKSKKKSKTQNLELNLGPTG